MDEIDKLKAELLAVRAVNQQMSAMLLRFLAAREGLEGTLELLDLIDQQIPTEVRNATRRERMPDEVARLADKSGADMVNNLRKHLKRSFQDQS